jgi:hypothetical protein
MDICRGLMETDGKGQESLSAIPGRPGVDPRHFIVLYTSIVQGDYNPLGPDIAVQSQVLFSSLVLMAVQ